MSSLRLPIFVQYLQVEPLDADDSWFLPNRENLLRNRPIAEHARRAVHGIPLPIQHGALFPAIPEPWQAYRSGVKRLKIQLSADHDSHLASWNHAIKALDNPRLALQHGTDQNEEAETDQPELQYSRRDIISGMDEKRGVALGKLPNRRAERGSITHQGLQTPDEHGDGYLPLVSEPSNIRSAEDRASSVATQRYSASLTRSPPPRKEMDAEEALRPQTKEITASHKALPRLTAAALELHKVPISELPPEALEIPAPHENKEVAAEPDNQPPIGSDAQILTCSTCEMAKPARQVRYSGPTGPRTVCMACYRREKKARDRNAKLAENDDDQDIQLRMSRKPSKGSKRRVKFSTKQPEEEVPQEQSHSVASADVRRSSRLREVGVGHASTLPPKPQFGAVMQLMFRGSPADEFCRVNPELARLLQMDAEAHFQDISLKSSTILPGISSAKEGAKDPFLVDAKGLSGSSKAKSKDKKARAMTFDTPVVVQRAKRPHMESLKLQKDHSATGTSPGLERNVQPESLCDKETSNVFYEPTSNPKQRPDRPPSPHNSDVDARDQTETRLLQTDAVPSFSIATSRDRTVDVETNTNPEVTATTPYLSTPAAMLRANKAFQGALTTPIATTMAEGYSGPENTMSHATRNNSSTSLKCTDVNVTPRTAALPNTQALFDFYSFESQTPPDSATFDAEALQPRLASFTPTPMTQWPTNTMADAISSFQSGVSMDAGFWD